MPVCRASSSSPIVARAAPSSCQWMKLATATFSGSGETRRPAARRTGTPRHRARAVRAAAAPRCSRAATDAAVEPPGLAAPVLDPVPPAARRRRAAVLGVHLVDHQLDQLGASGHVGVERHRADAQLLRRPCAWTGARGLRRRRSTMPASTISARLVRGFGPRAGAAGSGSQSSSMIRRPSGVPGPVRASEVRPGSVRCSHSPGPRFENCQWAALESTPYSVW